MRVESNLKACCSCLVNKILFLSINFYIFSKNLLAKVSCCSNRVLSILERHISLLFGASMGLVLLGGTSKIRSQIMILCFRLIFFIKYKIGWLNDRKEELLITPSMIKRI